MNDNIRERILRKLDALSDERGYQVLDYVEFLESRYAERQSTASAFTWFTEAVEDKLRAGRAYASAIAETIGLMNRAANVLSGAMAATQKMATEFVSSPPRQTGDGPSTAPNWSSLTTTTGSSSCAASTTSIHQSMYLLFTCTSTSSSTAPTLSPGASF